MLPFGHSGFSLISTIDKFLCFLEEMRGKLEVPVREMTLLSCFPGGESIKIFYDI
jgi:hypothetical protein